MLFFIGLIVCLSLSAQLPKKSGDRVFKAVTIVGTQNIQQLKKSLSDLTILRNSYLKTKFSKAVDQEQLHKFEQDFTKLEVYHEKKYGMIPGMAYQLVNDKASVSLILSDQQLNQIAEGQESEPKESENKSNLKKYPQFELNSAKAIQDFLIAANQGKILNTKIKNETEPEKLKKIEEQKVQFDAAMKEKYGIRPNLDYVLEVTSVSLYQVLKEEDLKKSLQNNRKDTKKPFAKI